MGTTYTANFGLAVPDDLTPLRQLAAIVADASAKTEAALTKGGVAPPSAQDLVTEIGARQNADTSLGNRATALEGRATALETLVNPTPTSGSTELAYATNIVAYVAAPWNGVRFWRRGNVVTFTGPFRTTAATAANALVGTLPPGFRPPVSIQAVSVTSGSTLIVNPDGTITCSVALTSGAVLMIPPCTFGAA